MPLARIKVQLREPAMPTAPTPLSQADDTPRDAAQTGENTCRTCAGRGGLDDGRPCPECGGTGRVVETVGDA
jgi:RecJ-like exonuclease